MKVLTKHLKDYIKFFGYTNQSKTNGGTPETNFFVIEETGDIDDEVSDGTEDSHRFNGFRILNKEVLSKCGKSV